MNTLYISYDGALDPLGSAQIIPYLTGLSQSGIKYTLMTYEKKYRLLDIGKVNMLKRILQEKNIKWEAVRYHKSPTVPATAFDILVGIIKGLYIVMRDKIEIIHARSFIGALPALFLKKFFNLKLIFDVRGFWPEERVDGGLWENNGWLYKIAKYFEKKIILNSDQIIVLTWKAEWIMEKCYLDGIRRPIGVIPTCVDLNLFSLGQSGNTISKIGITDRFIFTYLGSIGTWYCLEEMVTFFKVAKQKISNAYFMFLTPSDRREIEYLVLSKGISKNDFVIRELSYQEVPDWLIISNVTIFFIKPSFSKMSSCPTKFAESLACGIPVITNRGIGDCDKIINETGAGIVIEDFSEDSYIKAADNIKHLTKNRDYIRIICRQAAEDYFSLKAGIEKYLKIYQMLK